MNILKVLVLTFVFFILNAQEVHECISELPQECQNIPLSECKVALNPICEECKNLLPEDCKNKPLSECINLPPQCKITKSEPTIQLTQESEKNATQTPHDCVSEMPPRCESIPLLECKEEMTPVCEECKVMLPPDCKDKPLMECFNLPPQCRQPNAPQGTRLPPPKADDCSNDNAGMFHPESLQTKTDGNKTILDVPRKDGGVSGFEVDANGISTIGIKPPKGNPLSVKSPPCAQIEMKEDGGFNQYFNTDSGLQSELNVSSNGDFKLTLMPPQKASSKLQAPSGANIQINDDGSLENNITYDNKIIHQLESSANGDFKFNFKHPNKNGFNFHIPAGSDIELKENGSIKQSLSKDNKKVEFEASEDGKFKSKLELKDKDLNKTREFLGLDGSEIEMSEDTNITSIYYDYNNSLSYRMKLEENGTLTAIISKLIPQKSRSVEYLQEEIITYEMGLTYLDGGLWIDTYSFSDYYRGVSTAKIDANYTTTDNFSLNIDKNFTTNFKPLIKSTYQEITYLDKSKEVNLLSGKSDINITKDGKNLNLANLDELKIDFYGVYIKDNLETKESNSLKLNSGWNLISIPISAFITQNKIDSQKIWGYKNEWIENPTFLEYKNGYWVFVENNKSITFDGFVYNANLELNSSWQLLGNGVDLKELNSTIFTFKNNQWTLNPEVIKKGEGFWIKK